MNLPDDYPAYDKVISFDWYAPSRAERLAEVFQEDRQFSPEDCVRLQSDFVSLPARRILRRLAQVKADDPTTTEALQLLTGWDGDLTPDSAAGALFEVWYRRHLRPALLRRTLARLVPEDRVETVVAKVTPDESLLADPRGDLAIIERPVDWLGEDAESGRTASGGRGDACTSPAWRTRCRPCWTRRPGHGWRSGRRHAAAAATPSATPRT
jgi:penicillin amidase